MPKYRICRLNGGVWNGEFVAMCGSDVEARDLAQRMLKTLAETAEVWNADRPVANVSLTSMTRITGLLETYS